MIVFVDVIGLGMSIPVLPVYAETFFRLKGLQIAALTSLFFGAQFVGAPILGRLSDRVGRRPVLIFSQFGTLFGALLTAIALSPWYLVTARLIDGLTGGNITVAQAYLSDITPPAERAKGIGIVIAAFGMGFVIGPALGAFLAAAVGPRATFGVAAFASLCTILLSAFVLEESLPPEKRTQPHHEAEAQSTLSILGNLQILRILIMNFLGQGAVFAFNAVAILWLGKVVLPGWTTPAVQKAAGVMFVFVGFVTVLTQVLVVGRAVKKLGEARAVMVGGALRVLGNSMMAFFPRIYPAAMGSAMANVGAGVSMPCTTALLTFHAPNVARGRIIGLNQSAMSLGNIIGPLVGGYVYDLNPAWPPVCSAATLLVMWVLSLGLTQPPKPEAPIPAAAQAAA